MTPSSEISVERQFRFRCSCGATTESGEKEVICSGCGATLGIRRVRRHRQPTGGSVAYYGSRTQSARRTIPVQRVERKRQNPEPAVPEPEIQAEDFTPPDTVQLFARLFWWGYLLFWLAAIIVVFSK